MNFFEMKVNILTACSINGIITAKRGESSLSLIKKLNVPQEILDLQYQIRREYDAIMVGIGTVLIDDPKLNSHLQEKGDTTRITLDPFAKIPIDYHFLDGSENTIIGVNKSTNPQYLELLQSRDIKYIQTESDRVNLSDFLEELELLGINKILVEGGGGLNGALLNNNLVNKVSLIVMPISLDPSSVKVFEKVNTNQQLELDSFQQIGRYIFLEYHVI